MLVRSQKVLVLPCRIGFIKSPGDDDTKLRLNYQRYGDKYASMLSEGLKVNQTVKDYCLQHNRIHGGGASQLINSIGKTARVIDFKSNDIGRLGIDSICKAIIQKDCRIEILNLEDNKLGDENIIRMLKALNQNPIIKSLNISKNFLTNKIADLLASIIKSNDHLTELYLHWNQLKGPGGLAIFEAMLDNDNLAIFDISWNRIGQGAPLCV
jgi:hypothetical protein